MKKQDNRDQKYNAMYEGGKRLKRILETLLSHVKPGVTPLELDTLAEKLIAEAGGAPSFKTVGDYKWSTCICVNDCVVHGIPKEIPFKAGDIVGIDVGMLYQRYHTDTSWTVLVKDPVRQLPDQDPNEIKIDKFLETGKEALEKAIKQVQPGNRVGHISQAIQRTVEGAGYSVVRELVGHGVGKKLHEDPEVPGYVKRPIEKTTLLSEGMTLAVEIIYNKGKPEVYIDEDDGWTIYSKDGTLAGLFEKTVMVTHHGVSVLT